MQRLIRPLALILVTAAVGFVIADTVESGHHHASPEALTRSASTQTFTARYPEDWEAVDPPGLRGLALKDRVAVGPGGDRAQRMTIGTATVPAFDKLPAALRATLSERLRPQTVALGGEQFIRYLDLRPHGTGDVVSIYVLATTRATIVATCATPRLDGSFTGECETVLAGLRLAHGVRASEQVDVAYALGLNQILATLNVARRADGPGLLGASLAGRGRAADRLARAEAMAASTAQTLSTGNASTANAAIVSSLHEAASGYRALARAAQLQDRSGYEAAQQTLLHAQRRLTSAFSALARLGYALQ